MNPCAAVWQVLRRPVRLVVSFNSFPDAVSAVLLGVLAVLAGVVLAGSFGWIDSSAQVQGLPGVYWHEHGVAMLILAGYGVLGVILWRADRRAR